MGYKDAVISEAEKIRRLYTYNTLPVVYAYLGYQKKYKSMSDCAKDTEIGKLGNKVLEEISLALQNEFGFSKEDMDSWNEKAVKDLTRLLSNENPNTLGNNPEERLKRDEVLIGPAILCKKNGILPYYLTKVIAFAFLYDNPLDEAACAIQKFMGDYGTRQTIVKYCQLERDPEIVQLVLEHYNKAAGGGSLNEDDERIDIIKHAYKLGFNYESTYRGCAQCTLAAFFDLTGKRDQMLFQTASGFSGGMSLCGDGPCGGYSGSTMLIGSYVGRRLERIPVDGDKEAQYKAYGMAQRLHDKFVETYGSVICADIHTNIFGRAYCLRTESVRNEFDAAGAHKDKCTTVVATACMWLAEILLDEGFINLSKT